MNGPIYFLTGVHKPKASPDSLASLADTWEVVRSAAVDCGLQARAAVSHTLAANQGTATDAFEAHATGTQSASAQLARLADAASRTRDAHRQAAALVTRTVTSMDAIAASAAQDLINGKLLIPYLRERHIAQVLARAKSQLTVVREAATAVAQGIYATVNLPDQLPLSEAERRGSVPQEIVDIWKGLDPAQRRKVLDRIAEDVLSQWPPGSPRPKILYYSSKKPQPPGTIPPPGAGWDRYNGAAMGGDVYINYDIMADPSKPPTQLHTMVHEIQHIQQGHMRDQYDQMVKRDPTIVADIRAGRRPDPFVAQGSTIDEVERFKVKYEDAYVDDKENPRYYHQSTEIDARRAGTEYLDNLTPEQMKKLFQ